LSRGRAKLLVTAVRSFLRYLRHQGGISLDLAGCVPPVAIWSLSTVPKFLSAGSVQRVLDRCERNTPDGKRNYAVLLLLPDWVYVPARLLRWIWRTSIGTTASSPFSARVGDGHRCRCRPTLVKLSPSTCAQVVPAASAAVFSFDIGLPFVVLHTRLQFPRLSDGR